MCHGQPKLFLKSFHNRTSLSVSGYKLMTIVSIIIPVYNAKQYLNKCLNSCFRQTYQDIEVIAVNDGSTDGSNLVLDEYAVTETRLKVLHQYNQGTAAARNKGIEHAHGKWIMFVDSDDYMPDNAVELLYNAIKDNCAQIVAGSYVMVHKHHCCNIFNELPYGNDKGAIAAALLTEKLSFSLWGKIFSKQLFFNIHSKFNLKIGEDAYLTVQLYNNANKVEILNAPVYYYLQRKNSTTNKPSKEALASQLQFIEYIIDFYSIKNFFTSHFQFSLNYFIINESFSYLRMGGKYDNIPDKIKQKLNIICLKDKKVYDIIPFWRPTMLKAYAHNLLLGKFFRLIVISIRKIYKK